MDLNSDINTLIKLSQTTKLQILINITLKYVI